MDSSLPTISGQAPLQQTALPGPTSRCSRCVKDKKGCDRRYPCSRCIDYGVQDQCVYTGSVSQARQRPRINGTSPRERNGNSRKRKSRLFGSRESGHRSHKKRPHNTEPGAEEDSSWFQEPPEPALLINDPISEQSEEEINRLRILKAFSDIITHLPIEIYRSTSYIKALDSSYLMQTKELDDLCRELQHSDDLTRSLELRTRICALMRKSKEDRHETIAEVTKLQNMVDLQINQLSLEIGKIENPQASMPQFLEEKAEPNSSQQAQQKKRRSAKAGTEASDGFDIPIADDEPVYCYCDRVSFGKMLACENESCEGGEWFHFDCLGIKSPPRGKWYCDICREQGLGLDRLKNSQNKHQPALDKKKQSKIRGESAQEKRSRIREENRLREAARRMRLRRRR